MKHSGTTLAAILLVAGAAVATAQERQLTVATWGGTYTQKQRTTILDPFAREKGVKVLDAPYTGGLGQLRAMREAGNSTWDVVQLEAPDLISACSEGLVLRLDTAKLANLPDLGPGGASECGVGAVGWSIVIGYNANLVKQAPRSWADFWDVKTYPGKRAMRRSPQYALEAALLADGVAPEELYATLAKKEGVDRAFRKLEALKPHIQWWEAGSQPPEWLARGEVAMSTSYVGRLLEARAENAPVSFGWAGSFYSVDSWAIVDGSKREADAYAFLDYATGAKAQAAFSEIQPVAPVNQKAAALLKPERLAIMPIGDKISQGIVFSDTFWVENLDPLTERFNAWLAR